MLRLLLLSLLLALTSTAATAKLLDVTVDQLVATPEQFNGKRVSVTGYFDTTVHHGCDLRARRKRPDDPRQYINIVVPETVVPAICRPASAGKGCGISRSPRFQTFVYLLANTSSQSMSQHPLCKITSECLPRHPAVFSDLDYARLKSSFEYFVEHYAAAELITPGSHPVKLMERDEPSRMNRARRVLAMAIADFVDGTQDFCRERVAEIDRDLQKRDAYTLSFLREHFTTRRNTI